MANIHFSITGDNTNVLEAFRGVQSGVRQMASVVGENGQYIEQVLSSIPKMATAALAGFSAQQIVQTIGNIRGEFQQLEIAFGTLLGSKEKANEIMKQMVDLAATTPFDLKGVASGAKQLIAYGISADEVTDTLRRLGDISAGLNLNINDMAWLYGTTKSQGRLYTRDLMQFTGRGIPLTKALAEQFNVAESEVSSLVTAGKVGFPEVEKAIKSMTDAGGQFGGLMEAQSHSITGQVSNIQDAIDSAMNDMGKLLEPAYNFGLEVMGDVVENWKSIGEAILTAAEAVGIYKATLMAMNGFEKNATMLGYEAELQALNNLLPIKEQAKASDLEEAVTKGQLSTAQAELIASKRAEAEAYVQELQLKAAAAAQEKIESTNEAASAALSLDAAEEKMEQAQNAYDFAVAMNDMTNEGTLAENLNTATVERNTAARELQTARERVSAASKAADTAQTQANTAAQALNASTTAADTAAKGIWAQTVALCQRVQAAWNASMFSSPIFWIAAAIAGATYAIYKMATAESAHEAAIRRSNEAWEEFNDNIQKRQQQVEGLIRTIQSETATEFQKAEAYQQLSQIMPQITEKYDLAALSVLNLTEAQKDLSKVSDEQKFEKAKSDIEEYKKLIEDTKKSIEEDVKSTGGKNTSYYSLQLDSYNENLKEAEKTYYNLLEIQKQAIENNRPIEIRIKEAEDNAKVKQSIFDFYDRCMVAVSNLQEGNNNLNFTSAQKDFEEFIEEAEKELSKLKEKQKKEPLNLGLQIEVREKENIINELKGMKSGWIKSGFTTIPLTFRVNYNSAKQAANEAKKKAAELAKKESNEKLDITYKKAEKEAKAAQKKVEEIISNKSKYTKADYSKAVEDAKAKQDAFKEVGGYDVSKKYNNTQKNRKKEANEVARKAEQRRKIEEQLSKSLESIEQQNQDSKIAIMKEGFSKQFEELKNSHEKKLKEIDRQEKEYRNKAKEAGRKTISKNEESIFFEARSLENVNYSKNVENLNKDALKEEERKLQEYLKEYGAAEQRKQAIRKLYEGKINSTESAPEKVGLKEQMESELKKIDSDTISIDWETVFGNLENHTKNYLVNLRNQLQESIKSGKITNVSDIEKVKSKIDEINQEINKQGGLFDFVGSKRREEIRLIEEAKEAQEKLNQAVKEQNITKTLYNMTVREASETAKLNGINTDVTNATEFQKVISSLDRGGEAFQLMQPILERLIKLEVELAKAREKVSSATKEAEGKEDATKKNFLQSISSWFSDANEFINKTGINELPNLFNSLGLGGIGEKAQSGLNAFNSASQAVSDFATGNYIGALTNSISSIKSIGKVFGIGGGNGAEVAKTINELTRSNELLKTAIDDLRDTMNESYGMKSVEAYQTAVKYQTHINENSKKIAQAQASYYGAHHSWNAYWSGFNDSEIKEIRDYVKSDFNGDIWSLSPEEMKKLRSLPEIWKKIQDTGKGNYGKNLSKKLDDYISQAGKLEELTNQLNENITRITFDSMKSNFISTLMDMNKSAEDFTDDFTKMIQESLLTFSMQSLINEDLKNFYESWSQLIQDKQGKLTEKDVDDLTKKYQEIVNKGLAKRDEWAKITGYNETSKQTAQSGGFQSMGQETADELNGRFTALQIAGESISESMITTVSQMATIVANGITSNIIISDIRNLLVASNSYLEDLLKYSKLSFLEFGEKMDKINDRLK